MPGSGIGSLTVLTGVRSDPDMSKQVCLEVFSMSVLPVAVRAGVRPLSCVGSQVYSQVGFGREFFLTICAGKLLLLRVGILMRFAHAVCGKPSVATLAGERIFITVSSQMRCQMARLLEFLGAILTVMGSLSGMDAKVHFEGTGIGKCFITHQAVESHTLAV